MEAIRRARMSAGSPGMPAHATHARQMHVGCVSDAFSNACQIGVACPQLKLASCRRSLMQLGPCIPPSGPTSPHVALSNTIYDAIYDAIWPWPTPTRHLAAAGAALWAVLAPDGAACAAARGVATLTPAVRVRIRVSISGRVEVRVQVRVRVRARGG